MSVDADPTSNKKAVVLVSGGLDSATVLAMAASAGLPTVTRWRLITASGTVLSWQQQKKYRTAGSCVAHKVVTLDLSTIGGSALTDSNIAVPTDASEGIPVTYVPARNTVFLSIALGWAEVLDARDIFIGVNAVDYSGYPDCRPAYIEAFQTLANLATKAGVEGRTITIHAPLLQLTKAAIIQQGVQLNVNYAQTVSCYQADSTGAACGACDSCRLRREGFQQAGVADPTRYQ
jgi:7-cyano-7-deazaguanine synthase